MIAFLASKGGRWTRAIAGLLFVACGARLFVATGSWAGLAIALVGLVPLGAAILDVCLFAPLGRLPLRGAEIRALSKFPERRGYT